MNKNDQAINTMIKGILDAMKKQEELPVTSVFSSAVYAVNADGTYTIIKDKNPYNIPNGLGVPLSPGQNVWIMLPNGSMKDMFICGLK